MIVAQVTVQEIIAEDGTRDWAVDSEPEDLPLVSVIGLLETGKSWLLLNALQGDE